MLCYRSILRISVLRPFWSRSVTERFLSEQSETRHLPAACLSVLSTIRPSIMATVSAQAIDFLLDVVSCVCHPLVSSKHAQCWPINTPIPNVDNASPTQFTSVALGEGISGLVLKVSRHSFHYSRSGLTYSGVFLSAARFTQSFSHL